ncbi:MAG: extracellular solute-binding protein [Lachnospiraceae bacterium]|nr:extracellular solute-binding protein [Lachnospiraceae bacterium]
MKKLFAILLASVMVIGSLTLAGCTQEKKIETVDYYCNVGAYRITLKAAIDEFNAGAGKEAGVQINFLGDIDNYTTTLTASMEAGTHYDLYDKGSGNQQWINLGWVQDLEPLRAKYPELDALVKSYEPYIQKNINIQNNVLCNLPLEVVSLKYAVNTDLLAQIGKTADDIKTWEDMYQAAKAITDAKLTSPTGQSVYGFGWSTWTACWTRLTFQTCVTSTGKSYWDPATGTYDFLQWKEPAEYIKKMYDEGIMYGADDLSIDNIRSWFSDGRIGFFGAPSYDYAVYTEQFPAKCNWTVIEPPTFGEHGGEYKGIYMDRCGPSIDRVNWDKASDSKKAAIVKVLCFIDSDDLIQRIYEMGGMISYKPEIAQKAKIKEGIGEQWSKFGDIANYYSAPVFPDSICKNYLESGDVITTTIIDWMHSKWNNNPNATFEEMATDLQNRYNAAYQKAKAEDKDIDFSAYEYPYSLKK